MRRAPYLPPRLRGLGRLFRPIPVLSWTGGAFIIAAGLARQMGGQGTAGEGLARALLIAAVIQGWISHSLNDFTDWQSGTDREADTPLSGGTKVIAWGLLRVRDLPLIAAGSLLLLLILVLSSGSSAPDGLIACLGLGLWGAVSYSCWPLRLAYLPLLGEWLAAFPAIVACGLAFGRMMHHDYTFPVAAAAVVHGLLCVSWLMQHHLPDWQRDLAAHPPKRTTIAMVASKFNIHSARLVVVAYFLLAAIFALVCSFGYRQFAWSALLSMLGAVLAYRQDPRIISQVTLREIQMIGLTLFHALLLGWAV